MEVMSHNYLQTARMYANTERYRSSFHLYLMAIESHPQVKDLIELEFRIVLMKFNEYLAVVENNRAEILENFQTAMNAYPGNANIIGDIGKYLYHCSCFVEAIVHFERALQIDSSLVTVQKSLDNAKKFIFSRAHFRLLNDRHRNRAYSNAIRAEVMPNAECVLDADTGLGLSALQAHASEALSTAACEPSRNMARLAERVLHDNRGRDVLVVNKPPTDLRRDDVHGERTMLITNKFDSGLFGAQLLQTLKHAWENLLSEYGRVIPGRAEYYLIGAKCDRIVARYQVGAKAKALLGIPNLNVHTETYSGESYYGEDLNLYDDIEYVTDARLLLRVNFNNYYDVVTKLSSTMPNWGQLKANRDTELNVVVGWFKLYLTDRITLTTDPLSPNMSGAWQQAVFFDFVPVQMRENDTVDVQIMTYGGKLKFLPEMRSPTANITRLSPPAIAFLNDAEYVEAIVGCVPTATIYLGQTAPVSEADVADLSPFPLFGLLMLKRGARSLVCYARTIYDRAFFERVFVQNGVELAKVTILVGNYWNHTVFKGQTFHAIFCSVLDLSGDIDSRLGRVVHPLEYGHLASGGLFLPANISLMGQLISSEWLDRHNRMSDDESKFKVASQVNFFQASQAFCIDPTRLRFEALSEAAELADCCHNMRSGVTSVEATRDGGCNAVLCWYELQLLEGSARVSTRRSNSFVDSTAFLVSPHAPLHRGETVNVVRCVECDGSFKLMIHVDLAPPLL